ncbi:CopM family metallochaperone [Psychrobacter sp. UBA3962]|uniref:CopM family metallochaperone n=1 Tax=Psychrobacter sp. UBA3962 TaxID=1947352 RepID=UPI0025F9E6F9|nr:DUF305 domain-containing protein [Psychrobacter sp. UBA3962]
MMNKHIQDNLTAPIITNKSSKTKLLGVAALCSSALAFTACQPASEEAPSEVDTEMTTKTADTHDTDMNHEAHDMDSNMTEHAATTEFGKDYMDSMDDMHEDMMEGVQANDADVAFAKGMIAHHEGAVDMAEVQLKYGKDEDMRKLATDIIAAQEAEIKQMENWLEANPDTDEQDYTKGMHKAYLDSMKSFHEDMMQGILSEDADTAFAKGMLPHHQGAVAMAEVQIKYGKDKQMRKLAQDIIDAQKSEIDLMQNWINQHS